MKDGFSAHLYPTRDSIKNNVYNVYNADKLFYNVAHSMHLNCDSIGSLLKKVETALSRCDNPGLNNLTKNPILKLNTLLNLCVDYVEAKRQIIMDWYQKNRQKLLDEILATFIPKDEQDKDIDALPQSTRYEVALTKYKITTVHLRDHVVMRYMDEYFLPLREKFQELDNKFYAYAHPNTTQHITTN